LLDLQARRAAYWGYWLAFIQLPSGEPAEATGWLARALSGS
jgi:hypothetical protein